MFEAPGSDGIWEIGNSIFHESAILHLYETSFCTALEKKVDSGVLTVAHLSTDRFITSKGPNPFAYDRRLNQLVGNPGVDTHKRGGHFNHFPGVLQLPFWMVVAREIDGSARFGATQHAPRVGTMGGDDMAVSLLHIRLETLISLDKGAPDKSWPFYGVFILSVHA